MICLLLFWEEVQSTKASAVLGTYMQHAYSVQHWNRCSSWTGATGGGLQIRNKICQLSNAEVSMSSGLHPKPADVSKLYISPRRIQLLEMGTEPVTLLRGSQVWGEKAGCGFLGKSKSRCFEMKGLLGSNLLICCTGKILYSSWSYLSTMLQAEEAWAPLLLCTA